MTRTIWKKMESKGTKLVAEMILVMTRIYHQSNKELPQVALTTKICHNRWLASSKRTSRIIKSTKMTIATMVSLKTIASQMKAKTVSSLLKNRKSVKKRKKNVKLMKKNSVNRRTKRKTMTRTRMDP